METWSASRLCLLKEVKEEKSKDNQSTKQQINQSTTQQINRFNVNLLQQSLDFQQAFNNFGILIPSVSQVSRKFPAVLFHSFVVKSNIFSSNSNILVTSSIQVFIKFPKQYCFHSEI